MDEARCWDTKKPLRAPVRALLRRRHPHSLPSPGELAQYTGSLPQLLRLLMGMLGDRNHPATARAQLQRELKAAAAAALSDGARSLTASTIMQRLPPARLKQMHTAAATAAVAAKRRRFLSGAAGGRCRHAPQAAGRASSSSANSSGSGSDSGSGTATSSNGGLVLCASRAPPPAAHLAAPLRTGPACHQQQPSKAADRPLPSQQPIWDIGCLLETTLVAAAAEAQLASVSLDDPGSDCLMDDASSPVDVEGVMLEELELAKYNGLV